MEKEDNFKQEKTRYQFIRNKKVYIPIIILLILIILSSLPHFGSEENDSKKFESYRQQGKNEENDLNSLLNRLNLSSTEELSEEQKENIPVFYPHLSWKNFSDDDIREFKDYWIEIDNPISRFLSYFSCRSYRSFRIGKFLLNKFEEDEKESERILSLSGTFRKQCYGIQKRIGTSLYYRCYGLRIERFSSCYY